MIFKYASFALLSAVTAAATSQTATTTKTAGTHHGTSTAKPPANPNSTLPKVIGVPKTLFALRYIDTKIGTGDLAEPRKFYTVHYTGWFPDGTKFDSSVDRGAPYTFPYGAHRVIIGWDTGFQGMRTGGRRRLFVPYQLAYGEMGNPPHMPARADLIFDVEFISQSDTPPEQPRAPAPPPQTPPPADPASSDKPSTTPQPEATTPHPETL